MFETNRFCHNRKIHLFCWIWFVSKSVSAPDISDWSHWLLIIVHISPADVKDADIMIKKLKDLLTHRGSCHSCLKTWVCGRTLQKQKHTSVLDSDFGFKATLSSGSWNETCLINWHISFSCLYKALILVTSSEKTHLSLPPTVFGLWLFPGSF